MVQFLVVALDALFALMYTSAVEELASRVSHSKYDFEHAA